VGSSLQTRPLLFPVSPAASNQYRFETGRKVATHPCWRRYGSGRGCSIPSSGRAMPIVWRIAAHRTTSPRRSSLVPALPQLSVRSAYARDRVGRAARTAGASRATSRRARRTQAWRHGSGTSMPTLRHDTRTRMGGDARGDVAAMRRVRPCRAFRCVDTMAARCGARQTAKRRVAPRADAASRPGLKTRPNLLPHC